MHYNVDFMSRVMRQCLLAHDMAMSLDFAKRSSQGTSKILLDYTVDLDCRANAN